MKVCGITFVRNALKFDYPIIESIQSILPICDEFIVLVGNSDDDTKGLLSKIKSPKLKIIPSVWDDSLRKGGQVLAVETNKALDQVADDVDWIFYLQADEVVHQADLPIIQKAMQEELQQTEVEGLLFNYHHFWGSYDYLADSRKWYRREIRIIRNQKEIRSYKDAQGFRKRNHQKLNVRLIAAHIYHYGWVKPPKKQVKKQLSSNRYWHDDVWIEKNLQEKGEYDYAQIDSVRPFKGSHPDVMQERIASINWDFQPLAPRLSIKERFSRFIEKLVGKRIGEYKNYKLIR